MQEKINSFYDELYAKRERIKLHSLRDYRLFDEKLGKDDHQCIVLLNR